MPYPAQLMLLSMLSLMVWTSIVLTLLAVKRIGGAQRGRLDSRYYELFRGTQEPDDVAVVSRHFHNLLEMPPLFYLLVVTIVALGLADTTYATLAVAYTVARFAHAGVHLTVNIVMVRFGLFFASVMVQTAIAARLALHLFTSLG